MIPGSKVTVFNFLKLLFIVFQHIIGCVLAVTPDGFVLSEAFFEERSSTFCLVLSARSAVWVVGMVAENLFSGKHGCNPYHWAQPMTKRFFIFFC
jgi:hypothetical protein